MAPTFNVGATELSSGRAFWELGPDSIIRDFPDGISTPAETPHRSGSDGRRKRKRRRGFGETSVFKEDRILARLAGGRDKPPAGLTSYVGLLGRSPNAGKWRLFLTLDMSLYVEIVRKTSSKVNNSQRTITVWRAWWHAGLCEKGSRCHHHEDGLHTLTRRGPPTMSLISTSGSADRAACRWRPHRSSVHASVAVSGEHAKLARPNARHVRRRHLQDLPDRLRSGHLHKHMPNSVRDKLSAGHLRQQRGQALA